MEHITYSDYEGANGVKAASSTSFCGSTMKLDGIVGARHNDNYPLRESMLNQSLQVAQANQALQYIGYMDKAYFDKTYMKASYNARSWNMQPWMHVINTNMKRACLASVEWKFQRVNNFLRIRED